MQKAAFKKSLKQVTEPPRDVGIINDVSPTILGFKLTSSMNESAGAFSVFWGSHRERAQLS